MKFKKIVGFGDSWMWGDELLDPALHNHPDRHPVLVENTEYRESRCFLGQLGKHYGVPTENFGWPGGSQQSALWCYLWWLDHEPEVQDCLVLVGHTDANRTSFYNPNHVSYANDPPWNRFVHSSWVHSGGGSFQDDWVKMVKLHMVLTESHQLDRLTYQQSVLFFEGQHQINQNLLQFNVMPPPIKMHQASLLWPDRSVSTVLQRLSRRDIFAEGGHPNEVGHELIRDLLITEIDRAILAKC
jgi:hypothetical protein